MSVDSEGRNAVTASRTASDNGNEAATYILPRKKCFFFLKSFWRTHVLFWGHWYPCFGFMVTSSLGFKARVGSALFAIFVEVDVMYIPQDSPLVLHMLTSCQPAAQPITSPHACAEMGRAIARTEDERATIVPATRLNAFLYLFFLQFRIEDHFRIRGHYEFLQSDD